MNIKALIESTSENQVMSCSDFTATLESIDFKAITEVEAWGKPGYSVEQGVATIKVKGLLVPDLGFDMSSYGITGYDIISAYAQNAEENPNVTSVELHVDSPGGYVKGLDGAINSIKALTKPVTTHVEGTMASAAYWLGCVGDTIEASDKSKIGSIGVYVEHTNRAEALKARGIEKQIFKSGFWKGAFSPDRPLSEEEKERLQASVDEEAKKFFEFVAENRDLSTKKIAAMEGDTFSAEKALKNGLIDTVKDETKMTTAKETDAKATGGQQTEGKSVDDLIAEARAEALEQGRAEGAAAAKTEADAMIARVTKINEHVKASTDVKKLLASEAFASVNVDDLVALMDLTPSLAAQMDEEGGADIGADPTEMAPKEDDAKAKAQAKAVAELPKMKKVI